MLFLSRDDVSRVRPSMAETVAAVREVLQRKDAGSVQSPRKTALHSGDSTFFHSMPAFVAGLRPLAGLKWIAGASSNRARGHPYLTGLIVLNDHESGAPLVVMDASWITAHRTAAVSALTATLLKCPGSNVAAIIGTGVQARSHLEALSVGLDTLKEVRVFNPNSDATRQFAREMQPKVPGLRLTPASSVADAVTNADVVVSVTPSRIQNDAGIDVRWLKAGALGLPVDLSTWAGLATSVDLLFVDDIAEYDRCRADGRFAEAPPVAGELAGVLSGRIPGRSTPEQRIVVVTLGLAIYDLATAALVYDRALAEGVGTFLVQ